MLVSSSRMYQTTMDYFKIPIQVFPGKTEENQKALQSWNSRLETGTSKVRSKVLPTADRYESPRARNRTHFLDSDKCGVIWQPRYRVTQCLFITSICKHAGLKARHAPWPADCGSLICSQDTGRSSFLSVLFAQSNNKNAYRAVGRANKPVPSSKLLNIFRLHLVFTRSCQIWFRSVPVLHQSYFTHRKLK